MKTEEELTQDFKDWLGWNDQDPPDKDDPDYYTYSWGLNVWINSHEAYQSQPYDPPTEGEIIKTILKEASPIYHNSEKKSHDIPEGAITRAAKAITNLLKGE